MLLAHRYKNSLIAVERIRRDKSRAIRTASDIETLEAAVKGLTRRAGRPRGCEGVSRLTRSRSETEEMKRRHAEAKATPTARAPHPQRRAGPVGRRRRSSPARKANNSETATLTKAARERTASTGNRRGRGRRHQGREQVPLYAFGEPCDPSFKRWSGEAAIGIQVHQKGRERRRPVGRVLPQRHRRCAQLALLFASGAGDPGSAPEPEGGGRPSAQRERRDASDRLNTREAIPSRPHRDERREGRPALMATFPMVMHRPLPPNALIKRVVVQCRKIDRGRSGTAASRSRPRAAARSCPDVRRRGRGRDQVAHAPGRQIQVARHHGRWRRQRALG